jgi:hypothetical protein
MSLSDSIKRHPIRTIVWSAVFFLVVTFPIWLAQVWTLWSDRPFAEDMAARGWGWLVITPLYGWFCLVIGFALVGLAGYVLLAPQATAKAHDFGELDGKLEFITGVDFVNQSVQLDGKFFVDCKFLNATLVYDGHRGTGFQTPKFVGHVMIKSNNQAATKYHKFVSEFMQVPGMDVAEVVDYPPDGKATPTGMIQMGPGEAPNLDLRRIRILAHHAIHLTWIRQLVSKPETGEEQLKGLFSSIETHREMLLSLAPSALSVSVVEQFRDSETATMHAVVKAYIEGTPHAEIRAQLFTKVDHLLRGALWAWVNHGGLHAPRP